MGYLRMLLYATVCATLIFTVTSSIVTSPDVAPCTVHLQKHEMPSFFSLNGTHLNTNNRVLLISAPNSTECRINITEVAEAFSFPSITEVGFFVFKCSTPLRFHIEPFLGSPMPHIVQYIQITNCVTSVKDINEIASIGTARVVSLLPSILVSDGLPANNTKCSNLKDMASFVYVLLINTMYNSSFDDVLRCTPVFDTLAEVIFSGLSWQTLPSALQRKCPNLQALDIPNNRFTQPPTSFPWTRNVFSLPESLARSDYLQSHYVLAEFLNIPSHIFRRTYRLDDNLIRNLTDFKFNGFLHFISLERNEMIEVGENVFNNVTGLQKLSLSENELITLPCTVFASLSNLANLDLSKNKLESLCNTTFNNLVNLKHLNLANNSLSVLEDGLFNSLNILQVLHLEFNNLKVLNPNTFPLQSLKLEDIHLSNNPLQNLPEFVLWIRPLFNIDLHSTMINLENFTEFLENMDEHRVGESVTHSLSYIDFDEVTHKPREKPKIIDLSYSQIDGMSLDMDASLDMEKRLRLVLLNFKFILKGNPLFCDCNILPISRFVNELIVNTTIDVSRFMDWTCSAPLELYGRPIINISPGETYCRIKVKDCPSRCECFQREMNDHIIVDCRGRNLTHIHDTFPPGRLELWYSNNSIERISSNTNLTRAVALDISDNKVEIIDDIVSLQLENTRKLLLHDNVLAYLPYGFSKLNFDQLTLSPNPWSCDCNTLWMKQWLIGQVDTVRDLSEITCNVNNEEGKIFIKVLDEQFVCDKTTEIDSLKHVVLPSVTSTICVILFIAALLFIYAYRQECKVLMFVYFGVHPFDKDLSDDREHIDCIIVHSDEQTDWVMENVVHFLESEQFAYKVCDMARDFVVGLSFQENLSRMVKHSKRIDFCLTKDWDCSSDSFIMSWNIAQEKIKETRSNFGIVVTHEVTREQIKDKDLLRFLKYKRNVDTEERLFTKKLLYYMPTATMTDTSSPKSHPAYYTNQMCAIEPNDTKAKSSVTDCEEEVEASEYCHALLSYSNGDREYALKQLQPLLEEQGFHMCIPDRDFIAGASIESNILNGIESSMRTILVLSHEHIRDEWSLFTFRHAYEKTLRQKNNHLIVLLLEDISDIVLDDEMRHYLNHYITLSVDDQWYQQKLFNGLPLLADKPHLHTSPLYCTYKTNEKQDLDKIVLHF